MLKAIFVFLGGGIGALSRYILYLVLPKISYFPFATLLSNFLGCFIATVAFIYFLSKNDLDSVYKTLLITGFCGGLSTLSALSLELFAYIHNGEYLRALYYLFSTVFVCIISVILGILTLKYLLNIKI